MSKEIEIKARITDHDAFNAQLAEKGIVLSDPMHQHDYVFVHCDETGIKSKLGRRIFRIRHQDDAIILTLKVHQSTELESIEKEVTVSDAHTVREMLELLDFVQTVEIEKSRQTAHIGDYELCVDDVKGLGMYCELETFSDGKAEKVQADLWQFLISLGIANKDQETRGYDTLIRLKQEDLLNNL